MAAGASGIRAGRAYVELGTDDKITAGLRRASRRLNAFGTQVQQIGARLARLGAVMAAAQAVTVKQSADAQESMSRFRAVFRDQARAAGEWADSIARAVGRSRYAVRDGLATFQSFFVGLGFGGKQARSLGQQLQSLSLDFASFHNLADQEGLQRFISALSGSSEVLDRFGINIKQAALKQELLRMGVKKSWTEVSEQEKAIARMSVIMRSMTDQGAVGDAIRTAGSFTNRMKALRGQLRDTSVEIGNAMLPVLTPYVSKLLDAAKAAGRWIRQNKQVIVVILKLTAATLAAGVGLMALGKAFHLLGTAMAATATVFHTVTAALTILKGALMLLLTPIGLVVAAFTGLGSYLVYASGVGADALDWFGRKWKALKDTATKAIRGIMDALAAGDIGLAARIMWLTLKMWWLKGASWLRETWADMWFGMRGLHEEAVHQVTKLLLRGTILWRKLMAGVKWYISDLGTFFGTFFKEIGAELQGVVDSSFDVERAVQQIRQDAAKRFAPTEQQYREEIARAEDLHKLQMKLADEEHQDALVNINREYGEKRRAVEEGLRAAQAEWKAAIEAAKKVRKEREKAAEETLPTIERPEDIVEKFKDSLKGLKDLLSGLGAGGAGLKVGVRGTFQVAAVRGLMAGIAPAERTARATERTARATEQTQKDVRKLKRQARGGLVFDP